MNKPYHILVVDDEEEITELIASYLTKENYQVTTANNGLDLMDQLDKQHFSLIILDIMMPYIDGLEACKIIRERSQIPIIIVSAKGDEVDQIVGLKLGADDYLAKPFSPKQLMARVEALLRRSNNTFQKPVLQYEDIVIDVDARSVTVSEQPVSLTQKEFDILYLLLKHIDHVFSREELYEKVWGTDNYTSGNIRTIDTHIKTLRLKLGDAGHYIKTVWSVGYKIEDRAYAKH